ncbi:MAG TPA: dephospho-CoA kinase [Candidatus Polarisedimenticolaceae bacterium]|nr:dephospho-CoA kinase [Candidatus Polarisedimenticolaceae bacterium]
MAPAPAPVLRVGLTGGIASGKTTVGAMLAELGAFVVDADDLARVVSAPGGSAYADIVTAFGREILDDAGRIDRAKLATRIFSDVPARTRLEALMHPRIREEAERLFAAAVAERRARIVVFDATLLVETGQHRAFDRLLVVRCSRENQLRRLQGRAGMTPEQAQARLNAQAPVEAKVAVADHVIDTDGTLAATRRQVGDVYAALLADSERRFDGRPRQR